MKVKVGNVIGEALANLFAGKLSAKGRGYRGILVQLAEQ